MLVEYKELVKASCGKNTIPSSLQISCSALYLENTCCHDGSLSTKSCMDVSDRFQRRNETTIHWRTNAVQLAIWARAGLTKLPQSFPPDQIIQTIPTLAARIEALHHVAL